MPQPLLKIWFVVWDESKFNPVLYNNDSRHTNFPHRRAPFTCDAWTSPELLSKISEVAGIELTPAFDYEIANINISVGGQMTTIMADGKAVSTEDDPPAFAWHFDSFPFVCVTMLSDCTGMVGGETAIRTPSGEIKKIRGPAMVCSIDYPPLAC